jgi:hypothetical protein
MGSRQGEDEGTSGVVTSSTSMGGVISRPCTEVSKLKRLLLELHATLTIVLVLEECRGEQRSARRRDIGAGTMVSSVDAKRGMRIVPLVDMEVGIQIRSQARSGRGASHGLEGEVVMLGGLVVLLHAHVLEVEAVGPVCAVA